MCSCCSSRSSLYAWLGYLSNHGIILLNLNELWRAWEALNQGTNNSVGEDGGGRALFSWLAIIPHPICYSLYQIVHSVFTFKCLVSNWLKGGKTPPCDEEFYWRRIMNASRLSWDLSTIAKSFSPFKAQNGHYFRKKCKGRLTHSFSHIDSIFQW